jgi:hypothetical protein
MGPTSRACEEETSSDHRHDTTNKTPHVWTLENSSLWWLGLDVFQNPANILLMSSIPFCVGAYYGYARPGNNLEEWVSDLPKESHSKPMSTAGNRISRMAMEKEAEIMAARQLGVQVAARAFGIATLGTIGSFGVLTGGE